MPHATLARIWRVLAPLAVISTLAGPLVACVHTEAQQRLSLPLPPPKTAPAVDRLAYLRSVDIKARTKTEKIVQDHVVYVASVGAFAARSATYVDVVDLEVGGEEVTDPLALVPYVDEDSGTAKQAAMARDTEDEITNHALVGVGMLIGSAIVGATGIALGATADIGGGQFTVGLSMAVGSMISLFAAIVPFATAPPGLQPHRSRMNAKGYFPRDLEERLALCRVGERHDQIVPCESVDASVASSGSTR